MSRKYPEQEITAQCKKCLDLFTISLINRRGEIHIYGGQTAILDASGALHHRPGHCGGDVTLIWPYAAIPILSAPSTYDPLK